MSKPTITIHNTETDEYITREMNEAEIAQWEADKIAYAEFEKQQLEKQNKRQAVLEKLGLTEEEAKVLLG